MSRALAADAGHFSTLQVRAGAAQGLDMHLTRLVTASRELYRGDPGKAGLLARIRNARAAAGPAGEDCTVRIRVLPPHAGYRSATGAGRPDPLLRVEVDIEPPRQAPASPLRVRTHAGLRPFPAVKHLALDVQQQARALAREAGFDDALLQAPDGRISEGAYWNIVFGDDGGVVWPDAPALRGVTQRLLEHALEQAGVPQRRAPVAVSSLGRLRAAFAINSTGVADIAAIDSHVFAGDAQAGALFRRLLAGVAREPV